LEKWFAYTSLAILMIFFIEQIGTAYVEGIWEYLQHPFYVLDFVVIGVSILFEIAQLTGFIETGNQMGLIVLARIWRFARVGHGVYEVVHGSKELAEEIEAQKKELGEKQAELDEIHKNFETLKDMVSSETETLCPQGSKVCEMAWDFLAQKVNMSPTAHILSHERWEQLADGAEFVEEELRLAEQMVENEGGAELFLRVLATAKQQSHTLSISQLGVDPMKDQNITV
jgi:hypothetical protein